MAGSSDNLIENDLKCKICDTTFLHKNEAQQHLQSKKHKMKEEIHNQKCGIYVRGFHPNTKESELIKYFSQFGKVIWAHFGHDFLLLDFTEISSVQTVLSRGHYLHGKKLFVKQKLPKPFTNINFNNSDEDQEVQTKILSSLQAMNNFDRETEYLHQQLQSTSNYAISKYNTICQDLYAVLSGRFPHVDIHPFGSTITGLSFNNSDIDIFVSNVKQPGDDEVNVLYEIKKLLMKSKVFMNGVVIPGAKIPIIKFVHTRYRIKCDLNIKNMLGVCNSRLIHYYLNLHPKVKLVMIILKYWGKMHKITGQNHLLTNYSLVMLFIFFLQVKYDFPTVESLQSNSNNDASFAADCQESWNGNFNPNYDFYKDRFIETPLLEIVREFLHYYGEFSYDTDIINPFLGEILDKSNFKTPSDIPNQFHRYKNYISDEASVPLKVDSPMCIQDPFEHCRNISGVIADSTLERFVAFCKLGETICLENKNTLYRLLTEEPISLKTPEFLFKGDILELNLHKAANLKYLKNLKDSNPDKSENDLWFDSVTQFVTMAFRDFLGMTVFDFYPENQTDVSQKNKNSKTEGQLDVHDKKDLKVFHCEARINMWDARKKTAKQIQINKSATTLIERETLVTDHLKALYINFQDIASIVTFKLTFEDRKGSVNIKLEKTFSYKKSFRSFALFIGSQLPVWFEAYEKDLSKDVLDVKST